MMSYSVELGLGGVRETGSLSIAKDCTGRATRGRGKENRVKGSRSRRRSYLQTLKSHGWEGARQNGG